MSGRKVSEYELDKAIRDMKVLMEKKISQLENIITEGGVLTQGSSIKRTIFMQSIDEMMNYVSSRVNVHRSELNVRRVNLTEITIDVGKEIVFTTEVEEDQAVMVMGFIPGKIDHDIKQVTVRALGNPDIRTWPGQAIKEYEWMAIDPVYFSKAFEVKAWMKDSYDASKFIVGDPPFYPLMIKTEIKR